MFLGYTPSFFLSPLHLADGRLNTGHAGVLLAERRGSYPLIDLRILKSKSPHFKKNIHVKNYSPLYFLENEIFLEQQ